MEARWYYARDGVRFGPFSFAQLSQIATGGGLQPTDSVWTDGMPQWAAAGAVRGLFTPAHSHRVPALLMCVARSLLRCAVKYVGNAVGLGVAGDLAVDAYDLARDVWQTFRKEGGAGSMGEQLQTIAQTPAAEYRQQYATVVELVAGDQPPETRQMMTAYLAQIPARIRRSLRRPSDPAGRTLPSNLAPRRPEDLARFLPDRLPRFKPGDRPLPGVPWVLEELLGVGGFGEVWKARDPDCPAVVAALKFCLDPEDARALRHEVRVLNQLMAQRERLPGVVPLRHAYLQADPPCLEYEYVEGSELTALVEEWGRQDGGADPEKARKVMLRLAEVVARVHRLNPPVVHRDLKPANVLLQRTEDGGWRVMVTDFGVGRLVAGVGRRTLLTPTAVRGAFTPLYASPQQRRGHGPDPRDDVYALGVIWFQLLTGNLQEGAPAGHWQDDLRRRGMAESLIRLLGSCVAPRAEDRPADAAALAAALAGVAAAASGGGPPASPVVVGTVGAGGPDPNAAPTGRPGPADAHDGTTSDEDRGTSDPGGVARQAVQIPATCMMTLGGMSRLFGLFGAAVCALGPTIAPLPHDPNLGASYFASGVFAAAFYLGMAAAGALSSFAASRMLRLRSYTLALVGGFSVMVGGCACLFLGVPVGVWSLLVLMRPEVRSAFR